MASPSVFQPEGTNWPWYEPGIIAHSKTTLKHEGLSKRILGGFLDILSTGKWEREIWKKCY